MDKVSETEDTRYGSLTGLIFGTVVTTSPLTELSSVDEMVFPSAAGTTLSVIVLWFA